MQVEHELRDRALELRQPPFQKDEAGAGDLAGGGEIHLARGLAQRHVILGGKGEVALVADPADLDIAGLVGAVGHVVERQVGQHFETARQLLVEALRFGLAFLQALLEGGDLGHRRLDRLALGLGDADLAAQRLAPGLGRLALGDGGAPALVDCQQLGGERRQVALLQAGVEGFGIVADETNVVHG